MKVKTLLFLFICVYQLNILHAQKWLWGAQGKGWSDNYGVATDTIGNAYLAGPFSGSLQFGNRVLTTSNHDAFLVRYDTMGNILWARQSVSLNNSLCEGNFISTDKHSNVYYTGEIMGEVCFGGDTLNGGFSGASDAFLVKYDSTGNVIWAKQSVCGPLQFDFNEGVAVAADNHGNVFLAGVFADTISFGKFILKDTLSNYSDMFVVKYDSSGNVLWAKQAITDDVITPQWITVDDAGNVIVTGTFAGKSDIDTFSLYPDKAMYNAFTVKYDSSGNVRWVTQSKCLSSSSYCTGNSITHDESNNIYVTGVVHDTGVFGTDTLRENACSLCSFGDLFVVKYTSYGKFLWAKQSHGLLGDWAGFSITAARTNKLFLSGGTDNPYLSNSIQGIVYDNDTFSIPGYLNDPSIIFELDTAGHLFCGSIISSGGDDGNNVVCSPSGRFIYLGGDIAVPTILGKDTLKVTGNGENPFIARWQSCMCSISVALAGATNICKGNWDFLSATGGRSYLWSNGETTQNINVAPLSNTTYTVTVSNGICSSEDSIKVVVTPLPTINLCCDSIITNGQSVQLVSSGATSYSWSPPSGLSCYTCPNPVATPTQTTTYTLTVISDSGCAASREVTIDVECGQVFIPTAFTPNGSVNNRLYVRGPCIKDLLFDVFDRWGNKVFETQNKDAGWDGIYNGQPMNTGTYVYYAKATLYDGSVVNKKGNVTLVR